MRYCYPKSSINFTPAVICGMCRVGKTLIGNVISTCKNVEHAEEPWEITNIAKLATKKIISSDFASGMLYASIKNLFDETYLMRRVNFRPIDLSYIGKKKPNKEINYRINNLTSYRDVKSDRNTIFVINLSEILAELDFVYDALSSCKIINVIRHAKSVVNEFINRGWFTDYWLSQLDKSNLLKEYKGQYLPGFVKDGEEQYFLDLNQTERGFYYYNTMISRTFSVKTLNNKDCLTIKYEDFCRYPKESYCSIKTFLGLQDGEYTLDRLSEIYDKQDTNSFKAHIRRELLEETNKYLSYFNYEEVI